MKRYVGLEIEPSRPDVVDDKYCPESARALFPVFFGLYRPKIIGRIGGHRVEIEAEAHIDESTQVASSFLDASDAE
jgi:hypothetical protein